MTNPHHQGAEPVTEVQIAPETLLELIRHAYIAGCYAVHDDYQPQPDPEFGEAANDYAASLDLTDDTRPVRRDILTAYQAAEAVLAEARKPVRDAMIERTEEEWEALEDAIVTVIAFKAGHTLTEDDIAALNLADRCRREDDDTATEAHQKGWEAGLRERGGDELVSLHERLDKASVDRATEHAMRRFAEVRADAFEARVKELEWALRSLTFAARTSGGTAGPDAGLMHACDDAEILLIPSPGGEGA